MTHILQAAQAASMPNASSLAAPALLQKKPRRLLGEILKGKRCLESSSFIATTSSVPHSSGTGLGLGTGHERVVKNQFKYCIHQNMRVPLT